jgi:hypothetical protein
MSVLVDVVNAVVDVGDTVTQFISHGAYELLTKFVAWFIKWSTVAMWKAKLALLVFSWDVAREILISLHFQEYFSIAWGALDSQVVSMLQFFHVPQAVNLIASSFVTKYVLRFVGF